MARAIRRTAMGAATAVVGGQKLHPVTASTSSVNLDGKGQAPLYDAKSGTEADLSRAAGKIALVELPDSGSAYVYQLAYPEAGQIRSDRVYRARDKELAATAATYTSMSGAATDHVDLPSMTRPNGLIGYFGDIETVPAPFERTEYLTPGTTGWATRCPAASRGASS
ncbi:hypothetical protein [Streptomyces sp. Act143]|uniref:hypothetical protein n=1 Tax=Streptomyces sp. Act143 TaxID=2200760 RepID=UPI0015E81753|nr:hypothetical protein [Streptomyces sp. Act143]